MTLSAIAAGLIALASVLVAPHAGAATIVKADNTNALGSAASWVGGVAPTSVDVASWSGAYSGDATTNSLKAVMSGTPLFWQGLSVGALSGTALTTNVTAASQSGSLVTITTKGNHGFAPGQTVAIAGVTPAGYNGTFVILGIPSGATFTYSNAPGLTAGTAFGTAESAIYIGGGGSSVANSSLQVGAAGIDLSAASHSAVLVSTGFAFTGSQTWSVAAGRSFRLGGGGVSGASAKVVTSGSDGLIDVSGGGVVDANQGGVSGMADAGGFAGFTGKWRVNSGATLRGLRNGATAWGSNPGADSITLNGGTLAVGGISGAVGNWTWTNAITLAAGTTSLIDEQNVTGSGRYLKLNGPISGSGNLVFREPLFAATTFTDPNLGYILTGPNTMSGTVTIGGPVENGVAGRLTYVRVGGIGLDSTSTLIGPDGTLGTATITNNGVLTFALNTGITVGAIHGTGSLRVGYTATAGAESQAVSLTGANDYTGNTTVNMGTLSLTAGASIPNTPNIFLTPLTSASLTTATLDASGAGGLTLNNGQRLVGGLNNASGNNTAQVLGNLTAGAGSAIVPGGTNVVNTLAIAGDLNLAGGATLVFDVNSTGGDLLTAVNVNPSGVTTLLINPPSGGLVGGLYTLITASGTLGGSPANFALAGLGATGRGQTFSVIYDAGSVKLQVVGSPAALTWRGDGTANVWDSGTTTNWLNGTLPDAFFSGDTVTFDDTGSSTPAVSLTGALQPGSITVSATHSYTFAGSGQLAGAGPLTNAGPGTLSLLKSNLFTGKITVMGGGTLAITNEAALGANPAAFAADQLTLDGGTLSLGAALTLRSANRGLTLGVGGGTLSQGAFAVTVSNTIAGAGALTKLGTATLTLSGSNTYSGGTIVADGQVTYGHAAGLGRGASTSGTSGFFAKPFTLRNGTVDLNGKTSYDPNFAGGSAAIGVPVLLYDGPIVFGGAAGAAMIFQDTGGTTTNGWGNGTATANTLTYDATANPGTLTIAARFLASGSSGATARTFDIGDSTATATEVNMTAPMGVISVNATNQDGRNTTIVKAGDGTLQISASNNFPVMQVNAGTLRVNHLQALGADRTISVGVSGGTGLPNTLTVQGGVVDLNGFSPAIGGINDGGSSGGAIRNNGATASTLTVGLSWTNSVSSSYMGVIENGTGGVALTKVGAGTCVLGGVNTYTGGTTISNGTLEVDGTIAGGAVVRAGGMLSGFGTVNGLVTVEAGGVLAPGTTNLGTLTLNASPALNGAVLCKLDRNGGTPLADKLVVTGNPLAGSGQLVVTNTGAPLVAGDKFTLFAASSYSGAFTLVSQTPGQLVAWNTSSLAVDGSITVAGILPSQPPQLTNVVSGSNYAISWPSEYTGFQLQVQTNSLAVGLSSNWTPWPGSTATNQVLVPIVPANQSVFLRLVYPPQ